jgi:predicted acetylornithine/succinylornithine family transaminase
MSSGTTDPRTPSVPTEEFVMGTYGRQPVTLVRGQGARVWDDQGREYLDLLAGIAVCGVGHCHPHVVQAIADQAATLMHVSNHFYNRLQPELARRLCGLTGMDKAFFGNSGAEANECAIKIARKWGKAKRGPDCHEIVTFTGSFHGRTLATVTATAQPKYSTPFAPLPQGFVYVELGDVGALDEAISERTCAVMIEPIQGESGVRIVPPDYLRLIRALCDEAEALLILDEVQSGMGRTGRFLASQHADVTGDIVTLAKSVASGVPMGVCLARGDAATTLVPGDHGSTFGGQPLACASALATLDVIEAEGLMERATRVGTGFLQGLQGLVDEFPSVTKEARGVGLMLALELSVPKARVLQRGLLERGVIVNAVGDTILRFLPPLVISADECDSVVATLRTLIAELARD